MQLLFAPLHQQNQANEQVVEFHLPSYRSSPVNIENKIQTKFKYMAYIQEAKPDTGFNVAVLMSKISNSICCPTNETINSTRS